MRRHDEDDYPEYLSTGWSAPSETSERRRPSDEPTTAVTVWRTRVYPVHSPPSSAEPHRSGTTMVWRGVTQGPVSRRSRSRLGSRSRSFGLLVLLLAAALLAWQQLPSAELAVTEVTVTVHPDELGCDGTAEVIAVVLTNGAAGSLRYRWLRSDGTDSGELRERVRAGQLEVRLPLLWRFHGTGTHRARAMLDLEPGRRSASTTFTYRCR